MKPRIRSKLTQYAALIAFAATACVAEEASSNRLIVHEWGTFTSVSGDDGVALDWRPLAEPSDLPSFVYQVGGFPKGLRQYSTKSQRIEKIRMETPVVYFYANKETTVSVKVNFPNGEITEWYPQTMEVSGGIDWGQFKVMPGSNPVFRVESKPSHYYPARETDAAPIRVCGYSGWEYEKFLFYRGVGTFPLPLSARLEGGTVVLKNVGPEEIAAAIVFENVAGKVGYRILQSLRGEAVLDRPALGDQSLDALHDELEALLVAENLYEKEARAMVNTWRDQWFEEGLRVFYILPRSVTDTVLPLQIEPQPDELARVLVGRVELITPERERATRELIIKLGNPSVGTRVAAMTELRKQGRFAEAIAKRIAARTDDPGLRARIQEWLDALAPSSHIVATGS